MVAQQKQWVLLNYRMPREPSTPRIAVWRRLRRLGVAQLGDGLVALPADDRTVEHLEWVAQQVIDAAGSAMVWTAAPTDGRDHDRLVAEVIAARTEEYDELLTEMTGVDTAPDPRTMARWRRTYRQIKSRDYFDAPRGDEVQGALAEAASVQAGTSADRAPSEGSRR